MANVVPTDPESSILEPKPLLAAGAGGTEQPCHGPKAVWRLRQDQAWVPTLHHVRVVPKTPIPKHCSQDNPAGHDSAGDIALSHCSQRSWL